ncbi:hypothetical protein J6590_104321, partial [Homalodisca vitripennis]
MVDVIKHLSTIVEEPIDFHTDIQARHRVPTKRTKGPKPIVVQFYNRQKRDAVLKKAKAKKIKSNNFVRNSPDTNVYVNEHLTPYYKNVLFHGKKLKHLGYAYVWTADAKIFVRKSQ